ncbi:hypothetical protein VTP01DRAFT_660 [Rhizomucor pusillus]|uniref:uncharacterized protein n=1 Tax=Rhizomucor pusillus TaxID=4840 RepID=UPI003744691D
MAENINVEDWQGVFRTSRTDYVPSEYTASEIGPKEEEDWDDWEREDKYDADPKCLFCEQTFEMPEDAFAHCKDVHGFDFLAVKRSLNLDFYKCIRMINYIRKQVLSRPDLATTKEFVLTGQEDFWDDDELLQPVMEDDALLFAFEELEIDDAEANEENQVTKSNFDLSSIKPSTDLERYLLKMLQAAEEKNVELQRQFDQYKARVQNTFLNILADDGSDRMLAQLGISDHRPTDTANFAGSRR